jgi:hypothetical protein
MIINYCRGDTSLMFNGRARSPPYRVHLTLRQTQALHSNIRVVRDKHSNCSASDEVKTVLKLWQQDIENKIIKKECFI